MKRLILAALVASAVAPAAFAMPNSQLLSNADLAEIRRIVPAADLSNLTVAQQGALAAALSGAEREGNAGAEIRAILN